MRLVLYGVSSPYAAEAVESAARLGWEIAAAVRNVDAPVPSEVGETLDAERVSEELAGLPFLVPLIGPGHRHLAVADARAHGFQELASLLDPTAIVAASATLGPGAYVNAGAIVAAGVQAGACCSLNRGASIGHHSRLGDYVTVGPGAVTGGGCRLGSGAFLGVGAMLAPEVEVGANAIVGAGAVVVENVPVGTVVAGNPARALRATSGYGEVAVPA